MLTRTLSLLRSGLTSSTVPMNSAKGPSVTRTLWPFWKATRYLGVSTPIWRRMPLTSCSSSGTGSLRDPGMLPPPTKLVAPDLDLILFGHEDLVDLVFHAHRLDAVLEIGLDLLLVARVGVDDVPAL